MGDLKKFISNLIIGRLDYDNKFISKILLTAEEDQSGNESDNESVFSTASVELLDGDGASDDGGDSDDDGGGGGGGGGYDTDDEDGNFTTEKVKEIQIKNKEIKIKRTHDIRYLTGLFNRDIYFDQLNIKDDEGDDDQDEENKVKYKKLFNILVKILYSVEKDIDKNENHYLINKRILYFCSDRIAT